MRLQNDMLHVLNPLQANHAGTLCRSLYYTPQGNFLGKTFRGRSLQVWNFPGGKPRNNTVRVGGERAGFIGNYSIKGDQGVARKYRRGLRHGGERGLSVYGLNVY